MPKNYVYRSKAEEQQRTAPYVQRLCSILGIRLFIGTMANTDTISNIRTMKCNKKEQYSVQ